LHVVERVFVEWATSQFLDVGMESVFALLTDGFLTAQALAEFSKFGTGSAFIIGETLWDLVPTGRLPLVHGVFFNLIDDTVVVIIFVVFEAHTLLDGGL